MSNNIKILIQSHCYRVHIKVQGIPSVYPIHNMLTSLILLLSKCNYEIFDYTIYTVIDINCTYF